MTYNFETYGARDSERGLFISPLGIPSPQIEETRQREELFGIFYRKEPEIQFHFPYYIFSGYCAKGQKKRKYTKIYLEKDAVFAAYFASIISRTKPVEIYKQYEKVMYGNVYVSSADPPYEVFSTKQFKNFIISLSGSAVLVPFCKDFEEIFAEISEVLLKAETRGYSLLAISNYRQEIVDGWQGYEFIRNKFMSDLELLCNEFGDNPCR